MGYPTIKVIKMDFKEINIDKDLLNIYDKTVEDRRYFHRNPESSLKEYNTARYIRQRLKELDIQYIEVGETGTLGIIKGNREDNGKTIFLRADIDALEMNDEKQTEYRSQKEGLHHACGHDGHAAALLSAAEILNKRKDSFGGKIKLCFQQAEEIGAGARIFVEEGHLDDVDFVFGLHLASDTELGKIVATPGYSNASCDIFEIKINGKSTHAGYPHLGNDAAIATASVLLELQKIISRQIDPNEPVVISVGEIHSGTRYNVVAEKGYLKGTLRTFNEDLRRSILEKIEKTAKITASINDCNAKFQNYDAASSLINPEETTYMLQKTALSITSEKNIIKDRKAGLGAEDFADYLKIQKGVFARVGSRGSANTAYPHHSVKFDIDERSLLIAAQLHINMALDFLKN